MIHHCTRHWICLLQEGCTTIVFTQLLTWLRIGRTCIRSKCRSTIADIGTCEHGIEELRQVINSYVLYSEWLDVSTGLLVQHILQHGLIHSLSVHFENRLVSTLCFVNFVGEGVEILTRKNGWCTKDTQWSSSIVACF